jgi:Immunity protein 21
MTRTLKWVTTTGGPHVLIPEEQLGRWRGVEGWRDNGDPTDLSDYARACRITTWLGSIASHDGYVVVLSGDAGDIAWYPFEGGEEGFLVQWIGIDDERLIEPALRSQEVENLLEGPSAERLEFDTGPSGAMWLIDASDRGDRLQDGFEVLALRPGRYRARAGYYAVDGIMMVIRQISLQQSVASDDH